MKKYRVQGDAITYESFDETVEAESEEEAIEIVEKEYLYDAETIEIYDVTEIEDE